MSHDHPTKKEKEEYYLREFLKFSKTPVVEISPREPGDFVAKLCIDGFPRSVGIEVTEYIEDAGGKTGSTSRGATRFHEEMSDYARPLAEKAGLSDLYVHIQYDEVHPPPLGKTHQFGNEMVAFLLSHHHSIASSSKWTRFTRFDKAFDGFPLLQSHVSGIIAAHVPMVLGWSRADSAMVGQNRAVIADIIDKKSRKQKAYVWSDVDYKWLLIYTTGAGAHASLGCQDEEFFGCSNIQALKAQSGFDRIILWENVRGWSRDL